MRSGWGLFKGQTAAAETILKILPIDWVMHAAPRGPVVIARARAAQLRLEVPPLLDHEVSKLVEFFGRPFFAFIVHIQRAVVTLTEFVTSKGAVGAYTLAGADIPSDSDKTVIRLYLATGREAVSIPVDPFHEVHSK